MAEIAHTPTPWVAEVGGGKGAWIKGATGEWAAMSCGDSNESADANAALIATAVNMYDKHLALIARLTDALDECEDYFDNRADADCDQDGYIPNEEMKRLATVRDALAAAKATP